MSFGSWFLTTSTLWGPTTGGPSARFASQPHNAKAHGESQHRFVRQRRCLAARDLSAVADNRRVTRLEQKEKLNWFKNRPSIFEQQSTQLVAHGNMWKLMTWITKPADCSQPHGFRMASCCTVNAAHISGSPSTSPDAQQFAELRTILENQLESPTGRVITVEAL